MNYLRVLVKVWSYTWIKWCILASFFYRLSIKTYGHDAEIDVVPEHIDVIFSKIHDFEYFFHREINDEPDHGEHADQCQHWIGHSVSVEFDGPKRRRWDDTAGRRKFKHQSVSTVKR